MLVSNGRTLESGFFGSSSSSTASLTISLNNLSQLFTVCGEHFFAATRVAFPVLPPTHRLGDVAAAAGQRQIQHHAFAVVALVADGLFGSRSRLGLVAGLASLLQILVGRVERLLDRRRIALDAAVQSHRHHRAGIHVDGVFLLVGEVRAAILHLRDLRVRVVRIYPVLFRALLLPLTVDARQILSRRRWNS
jgi:hypothetical protein